MSRVHCSGLSTPLYNRDAGAALNVGSTGEKERERVCACVLYCFIYSIPILSKPITIPPVIGNVSAPNISLEQSNHNIWVFEKEIAVESLSSKRREDYQALPCP